MSSSSTDSDNECHKKKCKKECKKDKCKDRDYLCHSKDIKNLLAELNDKSPYCKPHKNHDECKYKKYHYNGSFHKSLTHDSTTGHLSTSQDFKDLVHYITENKQKKLKNIPLAPSSTIKLVDPLASLSSVLIGKDQCGFKLSPSSRLNSIASSAEMVELYSKALCRDVEFIDYSTNSTISNAVSYMTTSNVLSNLPDYTPVGTINSSTIFRGKFIGDQVGPYISQLLYLNVPFGAMTNSQIYRVPVDVSTALTTSYTVEWGRNNTEVIALQNGQLSSMPAGPTFGQQVDRYIHTGRALAEAVHNDTVYGFYQNATLILQNLGIAPNPDFPTYTNQSPFLTNGGSASVLCALAEASDLALKHSWYWKWQVYRKLRPEVYGLWVDNIKNNRVPNSQNYDIDNTLLNNSVLTDINTYNAQWGSTFSSYTLPLTYKEGSPSHPSYPSEHATIAGVCSTILKIYFDCEHAWNSLSGLNPSSLNSRIVPAPITTSYIVAATGGTGLQDYTGSDSASMTIYGEINKLCSNIAFGRDWAGVHYRSDSVQGMLLGEEIAISYMEDILSTWVHNNSDGSSPSIKFRKFDGIIHTLKPKVCKICKKNKCCCK
jgi:hypothetical protein